MIGLTELGDSKNVKKNTMLFNRRFAEGEQYLKLSPTFEIIEEGKAFYWQERNVFNIILPIIEMLKQKYPKITKNELYGVKGLVSMLVPIQRAYNAIKNAGIEKIKMTPITVVEDGSIDVDSLEEEGLVPGKILVYRQGANTPTTETEEFNNYLYEAMKEHCQYLETQMRNVIYYFFKNLDNIIDKALKDETNDEVLKDETNNEE